MITKEQIKDLGFELVKYSDTEIVGLSKGKLTGIKISENKLSAKVLNEKYSIKYYKKSNVVIIDRIITYEYLVKASSTVFNGKIESLDQLKLILRLTSNVLDNEKERSRVTLTGKYLYEEGNNSYHKVLSYKQGYYLTRCIELLSKDVWDDPEYDNEKFSIYNKTWMSVEHLENDNVIEISEEEYYKVMKEYTNKLMEK